MRRRPTPNRLALAPLPLAALALLAALAGTAGAAPSTTAAETAAGSPLAAAREAAEAARVLRYWTPERMREAGPLDLVVDETGDADLRVGPPAAEGASATASFLAISQPQLPPYSVNGRIFVRQGKSQGYCSGTAIDSPSRQLVLTAGHCVNNGREGTRRTVWSKYLQFVPAYTAGSAPFGAFVARRSTVRAPVQWTKQGNPDFDMGAFLTRPNAEGVDVADAVGGGAAIALGLSRRQKFQTFGYPGNVRRLQSCHSPYTGDDVLTYPLPGPPTLGIRCHWAPGASGGGWLINCGTEVNGINAYLHLNNRTHTFGPYFSKETVGKLVRGL
jgi:V8-like Glu-specific endopeptidase